MKVEINEKVFDVRFHRSQRLDRKNNVRISSMTNQPLIETECHISEVELEKEGADRYTFVSAGIATQHPKKDPCNKAIGRTVAFGRAIHEFKPEQKEIFKKAYRKHCSSSNLPF